MYIIYAGADEDKCSKCSVNARCVKKKGSKYRYCKCKRGYVGDGHMCVKKQKYSGLKGLCSIRSLDFHYGFLPEWKKKKKKFISSRQVQYKHIKSIQTPNIYNCLPEAARELL